jgi:hypothetical protein
MFEADLGRILSAPIGIDRQQKRSPFYGVYGAAAAKNPLTRDYFCSTASAASYFGSSLISGTSSE